MSADRRPLVVLGVGNVLLRDDGVGVRVVEALRLLAERDPGTLPANTRLVDGGTLGVDLLATVAGARGLLLVDAVDLGRVPGSAVVLRGDEILARSGPGSASVAGIADLLATARLMGWLPDAVTLLGIQVAEVGFDLALTPVVDAAVPTAVETACRELRAMDAETGTRGGRPLASTAGGRGKGTMA